MRPLLVPAVILLAGSAAASAEPVEIGSRVELFVVKIQDEQGRPLPGYSLRESEEIYGDSVERVVRWRNGEDVSPLAGRPVRLKFTLSDADLFAMWFE